MHTSGWEARIILKLSCKGPANFPLEGSVENKEKKKTPLFIADSPAKTHHKNKESGKNMLPN